MISQSNVAKIFGIVLLVVGIVGFVPNPIVGDPGTAGDAQQQAGDAGEGAWFGTNLLHNLVHVLSGLVAIWAGFLSNTPEHHSRTFNIGFGVVYALVTVLGFLAPGTMFDLLAINTADNVLHLAIAGVLLAVGLGMEAEDPAAAA